MEDSPIRSALRHLLIPTLFSGQVWTVSLLERRSFHKSCSSISRLLMPGASFVAARAIGFCFKNSNVTLHKMRGWIGATVSLILVCIFKAQLLDFYSSSFIKDLVHLLLLLFFPFIFCNSFSLSVSLCEQNFFSLLFDYPCFQDYLFLGFPERLPSWRGTFAILLLDVLSLFAFYPGWHFNDFHISSACLAICFGWFWRTLVVFLCACFDGVLHRFLYSALLSLGILFFVLLFLQEGKKGVFLCFIFLWIFGKWLVLLWLSVLPPKVSLQCCTACVRRAPSGLNVTLFEKQKGVVGKFLDFARPLCPCSGCL